jgi:hypothetical protein
VFCQASYPEDVDRSTLYVFPDGCTAHDECSLSDEYDYHHWHTLEARQEDDYREYAGHRRGR